MNIFCRILGHKWLLNHDIGPPDGWCQRWRCKAIKKSRSLLEMVEEHQQIIDVLRAEYDRQRAMRLFPPMFPMSFCARCEPAHNVIQIQKSTTFKNCSCECHPL